MDVLKKKFSLIEVLVVVAIIGILASLLMPALSSARESARGAQCLNNIKQNMTATMLYLDDNDYTFWRLRTDQGAGNNNYSASIFYDTQDKELSIDSVNYSSYKVILADYLHTIDGQVCPTHANSDEKHQYQYSYGFSAAYDERKLSDFSISASDMGAVMDIDYTTHWDFLARAGQITARHKKKVNLGFMDGHVSRLSVTPFFDERSQWEYLGFSEPGGNTAVKTGGNTGTKSSWTGQHGDPVIE
jgi:prepilin-type N-terminal cleavage/methylation domain-containing protein/prepilin-type processing-associated H-X9-DG protein